VADFNNDGNLDVASADLYAGTFQVLPGDGGGGLGSPKWMAVNDPYTLSSAAGDLNHDGVADLVVGASGELSIFLGRGNGTFRLASISRYSQGLIYSIALADFNGDGNLDIVSTNGKKAGTRRSEVVVLIGNGDGTFQFPQAYGGSGTAKGGAVTVTTGDVNGDGRPDIAFITSSGYAAVLLNKGDGTFPKTFNRYFVGYRATALQLADVNHDGELDLLTTDGSPDPGLSVMLGLGDGNFEKPVHYPTTQTGLGDLVVADFNQDGNLDVAATEPKLKDIALYIGNSDGSFQPEILVPSSSANLNIGVGDLNGDGAPDLVVTGEKYVGVLLNTGALEPE